MSVYVVRRLDSESILKVEPTKFSDKLMLVVRKREACTMTFRIFYFDERKAQFRHIEFK